LGVELAEVEVEAEVPVDHGGGIQLSCPPIFIEI
jgi:hypothetical protein